MAIPKVSSQNPRINAAGVPKVVQAVKGWAAVDIKALPSRLMEVKLQDIEDNESSDCPASVKNLFCRGQIPSTPKQAGAIVEWCLEKGEVDVLHDLVAAGVDYAPLHVRAFPNLTQVLGQMLRSPGCNVRSLNLCMGTIPHEVAEALVHNTSVVSLAITGRAMRDHVSDCLDLLEKKADSLKSLSLNSVGVEFAKKLGKLLQKAPWLSLEVVLTGQLGTERNSRSDADACFPKMLKGLKNNKTLRHLAFDGAVNPKTAKSLLKHLEKKQHLTSLQLAGCRVEGKALQKFLSKKCDKLVDLTLVRMQIEGAESVDVAIDAGLFQPGKPLTSLCLVGGEMTNTAVGRLAQALARSGGALRYLALRDQGFGPQGLESLVAGLETIKHGRLRSLDIKGVKGLETDPVATLKILRPLFENGGLIRLQFLDRHLRDEVEAQDAKLLKHLDMCLKRNFGDVEIVGRFVSEAERASEMTADTGFAVGNELSKFLDEDDRLNLRAVNRATADW